MPLSEKHRSELFSYFEPRLGTEVTEAMLQEFPRYAGGELVTREYLDLRLDALKGDIFSGLTGWFVGATTVVLAAMAICTTIIVAAN
jgi:hypothetical protein